MFYLFALHSMERDSLLFLEHAYLTSAHIELVRAQVLRLCARVRVDSVGLVDSWNLPDWFVRAPFGARDGNIYERYFAQVTH